MLGSFSRSPLQAHTGDPNGHLLVSPARGTTPYSHNTTTGQIEPETWSDYTATITTDFIN